MEVQGKSLHHEKLYFWQFAIKTKTHIRPLFSRTIFLTNTILLQKKNSNKHTARFLESVLIEILRRSSKGPVGGAVHK